MIKKSEPIAFSARLIWYSSLFGIVPWYSFKQNKLLHKKIFRLYATVVASLIACFFLGIMYLRFGVYYSKINIPTLLTGAMEITTFVKLEVTILGAAFWYTQVWEEFLHQIFLIKKKAVMTSKSFFLSNNRAIFVVWNVLLLLLFSVELFVYRGETEIWFYIVIFQIFTYFGFLFVMLVIDASASIVCGYGYIGDSLVSLKCDDKSKGEFNNGLQKARRFFLVLDDTIDNFNTVLGWCLLMVLFEHVASVLTCLTYLIEDDHEFAPNSTLIAINIYYITISMLKMNQTKSMSVVLIRPVAIYSSFFGIIPWYSFEKQRLLYSNTFKCYSVFFSVLLGVLSFFVTFQRVTKIWPVTHAVVTLQYILLEMAGLGLVLVSVFSFSFWNMGTWEQLFAKIQSIESHMGSNYVKKRRFSAKSFYIIFGLGTAYLVALFALDFGGYDQNDYSHFYYTTILIFRYIAFVNAYVIFLIAVIIKYRYEEVNWLCCDDKLPSPKFAKTLENAKKLYLKMIEITQTFTALFGWPILMLYFYCIIQILVCLSFFVRPPLNSDGIPYDYVYDYKWVVCLHVFYASEILIWLTAIVFCCDSVMRQTDELLLNCYRLEQTLPLQSKQLEELDSLKRLIKNKSPKLTAAGFFEIRRSTLLSLLSTTTTYYIVALQFNSL